MSTVKDERGIVVEKRNGRRESAERSVDGWMIRVKHTWDTGLLRGSFWRLFWDNGNQKLLALLYSSSEHIVLGTEPLADRYDAVSESRVVAIPIQRGQSPPYMVQPRGPALTSGSNGMSCISVTGV